MKLKEQIDEVLATLNEREQRVIRLRFGLDDGRSRTLKEIGEELNVTGVRVRQIECKALRKLRHPSKSRKIEGRIVATDSPEHKLLKAIFGE